MTTDITKYVILIICIIITIITNLIAYYRGIRFGMKFSMNKTYDVFMEAIYMKLKKDNKSEEEANKFMHDVHDLLSIVSDKI